MIRATLLSIALCVGASDAAAQSTLAEVSRTLRVDRSPVLAVRILTQLVAPDSMTTLEAVADSVEAIAVESDSAGERSTRAAQLALVLAGIGHEGTPYAGAADRIYRAAMATDGSNGGLIWGLTQLPDTTRAIELLGQVAVSANRSAYAAVRALANDTGPAGEEHLRQLHQRDLVREPFAADQLALIARHKGWKRN